MRASLATRGILTLCAASAFSTALTVLFFGYLHRPAESDRTDLLFGGQQLGPVPLVRAHVDSVFDRYEAISTTPQFRASLELQHGPTLTHFANQLLTQQGAGWVGFRDAKGALQAFAGDPALAEIGRAATQRTLSYQEDPFVSAKIPLSIAGRPIGKLIAIEPVRPATFAAWQRASEEATRRTQNSLLVGCLAAAIAALIASVRLWHDILGPIRALRVASQEIGQGAFGTRVSLARTDELGDLGRSIDEMAERLEHHDQVLNATVEERTRELRLASEAAIEAAEIADTANRAKSQFLANMSHEIRTPMNGVLGMTEVLLQTDLNETQRRFAETSARSARELLVVIEEILTFSSSESDAIALELNEVDLRETVEDVLELLAANAHRSGLELSSLIEVNVPRYVTADGNRLRQILINLTGNAIKFTEEGEVSVRVSCDRDAGRLCFSVLDTGVGIPPDARNHVFEPFSQADESMARRFGGTGLGLSISRHLVGLMGGEIDFESSPAGGTRFWFEVPLDTLPDASADEPTELDPLAVVVCSDSRGNREALLHYLDDFGAMTRAVESSAALDAELTCAIATDLPRVALLDTTKSTVWSAERIRELRALDTARELTIVLLVPTGFHEAAVGALGADAILTKPIRVESLRQRIQAPRGTHQPPAAAPHLAVPEAPARPNNMMAPLILLVEDTEVNQYVAIATLERLGCRVQVAENGIEALQAHAEENFDLVFMDCQMPEMDGYEATEKIRQREAESTGPSRNRIPIVAVTAHAMAGDRERCLEAGMDDYLTKPLAGEALQEALRTWLGYVAPDRSPDVQPAPAPAAATSGSPIERVTIDELQSFGTTFLRDLIDRYLNNATQTVEALEIASAANDTSEVARLAHSLKSSSAQLGAKQLAEQCYAIEAAGRLEKSAADLLPAFRQRFEEARVALLEHQPAAEPEQTPSAAAVRVDAETRNRVLIVDDDEIIRASAGRVLERAGCDVVELPGGEDALSYLDHDRPDLILLDVEMPGIDGYETCRRLRAKPGCQNLPILIMTGLMESQTIERAFDAGATDFIDKPLNWEILRHRVPFVLRASRAVSDLQASQRRLANAQSSARIGNWEWDGESEEMLWSQELFRILGFEPHAVRPTVEAFLAAIHPSDREDVEKAIRGASSDSAEWRLDHRLLLANGDERVVDHQTEVSPDPHSGRFISAGTIQDITERKEAENQVRELAYYDSLTALPNRRRMREHLELTVSRARFDGNLMALMFLDLDRFKVINDTLGHSLGDELLRQVAERLLQCVRASDWVAGQPPQDSDASVARLGGDEFTIILPGLRQAEDATIVAKRVLEALRRPFDLSGREVVVSSSIGIAVYPNDAPDTGTLVRNADTAMYQAKSQGRDNFRFYTESMNASLLRSLELEEGLRRALESDGFEVHYQPQLAMKTGVVVGAEALLRWNTGPEGAVSPEEFIPVAEESGLIVPLGEWVLRQACEQLARWRKEGFDQLRVAVNVSSHQFSSPNFAETVESILDASELDPSALELELTEGVLVDDPERVKEILDRLRSIGVKFALDDFGTGYSSLSYLTHFPFDVLKIDRSFVQRIGEEREGEAILSAIVAMARHLELEIVAEGVETLPQADFLASEGCQFVQGFLYSKPLTPEELVEFLRVTPLTS